ncbi:hypothetical protein ACPFUP_003688 [Vibrio cholerae]
MKVADILPEKVTNYTGGHEGNTCCGSWIKHWENNTGRKAERCLNNDCGSTENLVGAHVVDQSSNLRITIFCQECNIDGDVPKVMKVYKKDLVSDSKSFHCL